MTLVHSTRLGPEDEQGWQPRRPATDMGKRDKILLELGACGEQTCCRLYAFFAQTDPSSGCTFCDRSWTSAFT